MTGPHPADRAPRWMAALAFGLMGLGCAAGARAAMAPPAAGEDSCAAFLPQAERHYDIPHGLLAAIALTESGSGGRPYPWALNLAGQPLMADSYADAAGLLRRRDGTPRQDAAVGCMQIHMRYHLASVETPEWVLKPRNNVWYAAAFLRRLYDQYGSWRSAVGHYNASDPAAQQVYVCQVARSLFRVAPDTAAALGFPRACADGPRRGGILAGSGRIDGGWGRVLVGLSVPAPVPETGHGAVGKTVSVQMGAAILRGRGSAAKASAACAVAGGSASEGPKIIRAGKCASGVRAVSAPDGSAAAASSRSRR